MSRIIQCQRCGKERGMEHKELNRNWCPNCGKREFLYIEKSRKRRDNKWKRC